MINLHEELGGVILPCIEVKKDEDYSRYGIVEGDKVRPDVIKMRGLTEKPGKDKATSDFASVGGYLLTPEIFSFIEKGLASVPQGEEFYLTTYGLDPMIRDGKDLYACMLKNSRYYDTGNKLEYLKTVVDFALKNAEIKDEFHEYLKNMV
jgi:UTP--glucose-1-phosphate uridylyltransferase